MKTKQEKLPWLEIIQFSKGWYSQYFPKDWKGTRIDALRIVQGILCGVEPRYVNTVDMVNIVAPLYLKHVLLNEKNNAEHEFKELISLSPFFRYMGELNKDYIANFKYNNEEKSVTWISTWKVQTGTKFKNKEEFEEYFNKLPIWDKTDYYTFSPRGEIIDLYDCKTGIRISKEIENEYNKQTPSIEEYLLSLKTSMVTKKELK